MKDFRREQNDFKEAIKLIRKIAHEEFRKQVNQDDQKDAEDILIDIENACLDYLEERGL